MFQICFCQCQFYFLCPLVWQWRGAGPNFVRIKLGRIGVDTYTNFVLLLDTSGVVRGTQLVFIANPMVLVRNKFNSIQFPLFPKKLVFIWKKVYHKVSSMNFVKKKEKRAGGRWHNSSDTQFYQELNCATKKCLKLLCIFSLIFRSGDCR